MTKAFVVPRGIETPFIGFSYFLVSLAVTLLLISLASISQRMMSIIHPIDQISSDVLRATCRAISPGIRDILTVIDKLPSFSDEIPKLSRRLT